MNQIIKENLERRFSALLEHKNEPEFVLLELDYIEYLGKNKIIGKIIKELIEEGKLHKNTLQHFYNMFMIITSMRQFEKKDAKIIAPSFFDMELEKKFMLHLDFVKMISGGELLRICMTKS